MQEEKEEGRRQKHSSRKQGPENKTDQTKTAQGTEGSRAGGRPRETALTTQLLHLLENGGNWRMGPPQENWWAAGPGGHRYHLGQRSGLAGYGAQASGLLITLV
ncbi:hypothetical protein QQF64_030368 [Cirrhinus molitorella]|uniref:Uncharacterized protein n=1 Tax=Cirrhinus molitorella TaxID=172907 RepID=A0ABR3N342_9TELE